MNPSSRFQLTFFETAFNRRIEQRIVFINAVGFTMFITFDIVFVVSLGSVEWATRWR